MHNLKSPVGPVNGTPWTHIRAFPQFYEIQSWINDTLGNFPKALYNSKKKSKMIFWYLNQIKQGLFDLQLAILSPKYE